MISRIDFNKLNAYLLIELNLKIDLSPLVLNFIVFNNKV